MPESSSLSKLKRILASQEKKAKVVAKRNKTLNKNKVKKTAKKTVKKTGKKL